MNILNGWLFEENLEGHQAYISKKEIDLKYLVNLSVAMLCVKVPGLKPGERENSIKFLKLIWGDDSKAFFAPEALAKCVLFLNDSDANYVDFYHQTLERALFILTKGTEIPEILMNTVQYGEIVRQSYFTVSIVLEEGWRHPLSEFRREDGYYEAANSWAVASLYAGAVTHRYKDSEFRATGVSFQANRNLNEGNRQLIATASQLDSAYLALINKIRYENEHLDYQ